MTAVYCKVTYYYMSMTVMGISIVYENFENNYLILKSFSVKSNVQQAKIKIHAMTSLTSHQSKIHLSANPPPTHPRTTFTSGAYAIIFVPILFLTRNYTILGEVGKLDDIYKTGETGKCHFLANQNERHF